MIGEMRVLVTLLAPTGDRTDALIRVEGPGEGALEFRIEVTRTVQRIWQVADQEQMMRDLATGIVEIIGTAGTPPTGGYWFDSYNSEQTIKATMDKIRNFGIASFLKNRSVGDEIAKIFGGDLLPILSRANEVFAEAEQVQFVRSLDSAFEYSEAAADLSSPPSTKPDFLYRICILSVIVDRLGVRLPTEQRDTGSLKALKNWLATRAENEVVQSMTAAFAHVKDLRKQYPIHEHYVADSEGQLIVRSELQRAEEYFAFKPHHDWSAKWKLVVDSFQDAVEVLIELETPGQATSPKLATRKLSGGFESSCKTSATIQNPGRPRAARGSSFQRLGSR